MRRLKKKWPFITLIARIEKIRVVKSGEVNPDHHG